MPNSILILEYGASLRARPPQENDLTLELELSSVLQSNGTLLYTVLARRYALEGVIILLRYVG